MRRVFITLIFLIFGQPTFATDILSGEDFERRYEGKTLHFGLDGKHFGSEQFLEGRQTIWKFAEDQCVRGVWFMEGAQICFLYEEALEKQCWLMILKNEKLFVRSTSSTDGLVLELQSSDTKPLHCPGPGVGV